MPTRHGRIILRREGGTPDGVPPLCKSLYWELILQKQVAGILRAHSLFSRSCKILVACSGGTDSLVLLDILDALRSTDGPHILCAHYEHGIRGEESRADAHFVEAFCRERAIPFVRGAGDVPAYARTHRLSMETAARICRYDFLHRVRVERACCCIATAHHADDLAETVLMRILRGTGPAGLAAMKEWDGVLLRPLLSVTRGAIEAYANKRELAPRHDLTNDLLDARRNRIRHQLMPELRTYNPSVQAALTRLSTLAAEEDGLLSSLAAEALLRAECTEGLAVTVLRDLHPALQRRVLRLFWMRETGMVHDFSYLHEERLRTLLYAKEAARCGMPCRWYAVSHYGLLTLHRETETRAAVENEEILLSLTREYDIINFQGMEFHVQRLTYMTVDDWCSMAERTAVYADLSALPQLVLRTRHAGDYMRLPVGRKKIKDILIDDKIPREQRDSIPLVAFAHTNEIFWMAGGRRSVCAPVIEPGGDILRIECVKETTAK